MSKCLDCGREMHPLDAQEYEQCGKCRHSARTVRRIKAIYRGGRFDSRVPVENDDVLRRGELSVEMEIAKRHAKGMRMTK